MRYVTPVLVSGFSREEEVTSCQDQLGEFRSAASALRIWLGETVEKLPALQPTSSQQSLARDLQEVNVSHRQAEGLGSDDCTGV